MPRTSSRKRNLKEITRYRFICRKLAKHLTPEKGVDQGLIPAFAFRLLGKDFRVIKDRLELPPKTSHEVFASLQLLVPRAEMAKVKKLAEA